MKSRTLCSRVIPKSLLPLLAIAGFGWHAARVLALDSNLAPKDNFNLTHWKLQLPVNSSGVPSGANDNVEVSVTQLNNGLTNAYFNGFTNAYFYTGKDGAMVFWVPDNGSTTSGSSHPRSELREMLNPGDAGVNWTPYGAHLLSATCVVSNVPADTKKVCIAQVHEQVGANIPMVMIMFYNNTLYADIWSDGNDNNSSSAYAYGSCSVGATINYQIQVTNGVLSVAVNGITNTVDLFNHGVNWQTNAVYFKAGAYSQTTNQCNCATDGAKVAFYALAHYHAPSVTFQPSSRAVLAGSNTSFSVGALGNGALTYQWWFNATNSLAGATDASLSVTNVSGANAGNYAVVVSDSFGSVTSATAALAVTYPASSVTFSNPGGATWTCPAGVTAVQVEGWGGGGAGGSALRTSTGNAFGGGGAGGGYARLNAYAVTPGMTYALSVGAGGVSSTADLAAVSGGDTWFNDATTLVAKGGAGGVSISNLTTSGRAGAGGTGSLAGSTGDVKYPGGSGCAGQTSSGSPANIGGGGGGGAGGSGAGASAITTNGAAGGDGGGGMGGSGVNYNANGSNGSAPGGGGGGARSSSAGAQRTGGSGGAGLMVLTYMNRAATAAILVSSRLTGSVLNLVWQGGTNASGTLLTATNLAPARTTWTPVATNLVGANGLSTNRMTINPGESQRFFLLSVPAN